MTEDTPYSSEVSERYIRDSLDQWALAVPTCDLSVINRILAEDLVWHYDGKKLTKQDALNEVADGSAGCVFLAVEEVTVTFNGDTAVSKGIESFKMKDDESGRLAFYYLWERRDGQWLIVDAKDELLEGS